MPRSEAGALVCLAALVSVIALYPWLNLFVRVWLCAALMVVGLTLVLTDDK